MTHLKTYFLVSASAFCLFNASAYAQGATENTLGDDGAAIESIVIIGSREAAQKAAGSAAYLGAEELEKFEYNDVLRVLRQIPGVNIQEEDGFGLRPNIGLRGTSVERSEKITLLEDGVLIAPAPYSAPAAYYFPSIGRISAVEVSKGPATIQHGPNTVGGAINLVSTPIPDEFSGKLEARFGSWDTYQVHAHVGGKVDGFGVLAETLQSGSNGFKDIDGGGDSGYQIEDYQLKLSYETDDNAAYPQSLVVKLGYTDQRSNETYLGLTDEDFAADHDRRYVASANDRFDSEHKQIQITHKIELGPDFDFTTVGYYNDFERDWFKIDDVNFGDGRGRIRPTVLFNDPTDPLNVAGLAVLRGEVDSVDDAIQLRHNAREYYSWGIQGIGHYRFSTGALDHEAQFSIRYHKDEEDRLQNRENFAIRNGVLVPTSIDPIGSQGNRVQQAQAWSFYVSDRIEWGELTVTPGVRIESIELERFDFDRADPERFLGATRERENDLTTILPGLGVTYQVNDEVLVLAGVHRGFSPPSPGRDQADAEKSVNYEAGFRYNQQFGFIEAIGFFSDYSNVLGNCTNSSGCTSGDIGDQFNGGDVHTLGLELSGGLDIPLSFDLLLPIRFNYTFTDAEFRESFDSDFFGDVLRGDALPYIPRHQGYVSAGIDGGYWDVTLSANYVGETRTEAGSGPVAPLEEVNNRTVFDLAASYDLMDNVRLFFSVDNLFDNKYAVARRPYGLRPGKPQSFTGGISIEF